MDLRVEVKPNAREASVVKSDANLYKVFLRSRAAEGKANEELVAVLAEHFGVSKSMVEIVSGLSSRVKRVSIISD